MSLMRSSRTLWRYRWLYLMIIPGALFFIIFRYAPMGGLVIAFQNYQPFLGIAGSDWVGLRHFERLFMEDTFFLLLSNTLILFGLGVLTFPLPIILALLLNEVRRKWFRNIVQSVLYIPHFMSWVIVVSLFSVFLTVDRGLINELIRFFGGDPIHFLTDPNWARTIYIIQDIWKNIGWNTIIYSAAIASVDVSLFEATSIDGAGRFRQIWHVTLPAIRPTIVILFILRTGSILEIGFEHVFLLINALNRSVLEIFDTFVFTAGLMNGQLSFSTAVGLFRGIAGLIMVVGANMLAKKFGEEGIY